MKLKTLFAIAVVLLLLSGNYRIFADSGSGKNASSKNQTATNKSLTSQIPLISLPLQIGSQSNPSQSQPQIAPAPTASAPVQSPTQPQKQTAKTSNNSSSNSSLQTSPVTNSAVSSLAGINKPASGFSYAENKFSPQATAILYTAAAVLAVIGFALATSRKKQPFLIKEISDQAANQPAIGTDTITIIN